MPDIFEVTFIVVLFWLLYEFFYGDQDEKDDLH